MKSEEQRKITEAFNIGLYSLWIDAKSGTTYWNNCGFSMEECQSV